jgi:hypothetical protein
MTVTGRPAQFGRGVMAEVGGRIIGKFASNLAAQLSGEGTAAGSAGEAPGTSAASSGAASTPAASGPSASTGTTAAVAPGAGDEGGVNGLAADAAQLPIEELNLPVRSFNSLRREGVHTVGGLAGRTEKELLAIDGLGPQSIKEIKAKLAEHGLALATPGVTADAATGSTAASGPATAATAAAGTAGTRPAAVSPGAGAGSWDAGTPSADRPAANGLLPPRSARPQDEDALDLLSVAGLPLLKRFAPVLGALIFAGVLLRIMRRRRRASRA